MAKIKISQLTAKGSNLANTDLLPIAEVAGSAYVTKRITGAQAGTGGATLTVGTTLIASGTVGRVLFQGSGNVLQQSANLFWDNTNNALGLGASPLSTSRLDIRAKDGLNTSQSFRIRNSTDTTTQFEVNGQGLTTINTSGGGGANSFSVSFVGGNEIFRVQENNVIRFRSVSTFAENVGLNFFGGNDITNSFLFSYANTLSIGGASRNHVAYSGTVNLTNGTNTFNGLNINHSITGISGTPTNTLGLINIAPTINITNGTSTLRGLFYNPTLTSTTGVTHRAIETTTGDVIFNSTSGSVVIGSTSPGARLDVRAQGALSTDIAFRVRNSADTQNLMSIAGNGDVAIGLNASGVNATFAPGFVAIGTNAKTSQYGLSIGYEAGKNQDNGDRRNVYLGVAVASTGTNSTGTYNVGIGNNALYRVTSGSNNVAIGGVTACFNLTTASDNTIIGTEAGYDITTGAGNTAVGRYAGVLNATGTGNTQIGYAVHQAASQNKSHNTGIGVRMQSSHDGAIMIGSSGDLNTNATSIANDAAQFHFRSANQSFFFNKNTNVVLKSNSALTSGTHFEAAATNTITIHNGTAPIANIADAYAQYSADIVAGNAAPHFRTENGAIVKVYQETTGVGSATVASAGAGNTIKTDDTFDGYTIQQVVKALRNLGILA